jgi:hypothetical protein
MGKQTENNHKTSQNDKLDQQKFQKSSKERSKKSMNTNHADAYRRSPTAVATTELATWRGDIRQKIATGASTVTPSRRWLKSQRTGAAAKDIPDINGNNMFSLQHSKHINHHTGTEEHAQPNTERKPSSSCRGEVEQLPRNPEKLKGKQDVTERMTSERSKMKKK